MSGINLIPEDALTQRLLVEVLTAMFKNYMATKRAAATSEFPRPNVATADTSSAQANTQSDSTTVTVSSQSEEDELGSHPEHQKCHRQILPQIGEV